ncbi:MAG TPA: FGGY family carbohydrate kinase [Geminicoccaceae bacterium]|nr:FGGY family carbohydrate kinase [Geminicoccus sp.]HMU53122.1 FGGY family carbohydrate kinase [Geminicoccaceae bacterium]
MSAGPLLCGVDAGTSRIRAIVFETDGRQVAEAAVPTPTSPLGPGMAEHDAEALWAAATRAIAAAAARLDDPARVRGIAVASFGEAGVALDAAGRPAGPVIAWFDNRTAPLLAELVERIGFERLHRLTGLCPDPTFSLLKLLWLRRHDAAAFARATAWLHIADFLAWRLSGEMATDISLASRTMALDLAAGRWASALVEEVGIEPGLFRPLADPGQLLGRLTAEAAAATGLEAGIAVGVAGHDHVCGMLAVAADRQGAVLDSMGTAEALTFALDRPITDAGYGRLGFNQGAVRGRPRLLYAFGGLPTSAACVEWFRAALGGDAGHAGLIEEAEREPFGGNGLLFLPHLRIGSPPWPDPVARGAFLGLSDRSGRGALFRAVIEGVALDAAHMLRAMLAGAGQAAPRRLVAIGGSTRNRLLMRVKASLLGLPIDVAETTESTSLGAAMLAGVAAGLFADLAAAQAAMRPAFREVTPDPAWAEASMALLEAYGEAYAGTRELQLRLRRRLSAASSPPGG